MGHPSFAVGVARGSTNAKRPGLSPRPFALLTLVAEEQDASGFVFSHFADRPVEELIVVEIYLEECRTLGNAAGDQCFRQWIFDIALQRAAQRTRPVRAVD